MCEASLFFGSEVRMSLNRDTRPSVSAGLLFVLSAVFVAITVLAALDYHEDGLEHAGCPLCQLSAALHSTEPSPPVTVDAIASVRPVELSALSCTLGVVPLIRKPARSPPVHFG